MKHLKGLIRDILLVSVGINLSIFGLGVAMGSNDMMTLGLMSCLGSGKIITPGSTLLFAFLNLERSDPHIT